MLLVDAPMSVGLELPEHPLFPCHGWVVLRKRGQLPVGANLECGLLLFRGSILARLDGS